MPGAAVVGPVQLLQPEAASCFLRTVGRGAPHVIFPLAPSPIAPTPLQHAPALACDVVDPEERRGIVSYRIAQILHAPCLVQPPPSLSLSLTPSSPDS